MSESQAIEAGAEALYQSVVGPTARWDLLTPGRRKVYVDRVRAALEPMRTIIRKDERAKVCLEEGHKAFDATTLGQTELHLWCGRCGAQWTEPRPASTRPEPLDVAMISNEEKP